MNEDNPRYGQGCLEAPLALGMGMPWAQLGDKCLQDRDACKQQHGVITCVDKAWRPERLG